MSDNDLEPDEYVVERVLGKRIGDDGRVQYRIKWKGYSKRESTWEPEENLNCPDLVGEFELSLLASEDSNDDNRSRSPSPRPHKKLRIRQMVSIPESVRQRVEAAAQRRASMRRARRALRNNVPKRVPETAETGSPKPGVSTPPKPVVPMAEANRAMPETPRKGVTAKSRRETKPSELSELIVIKAKAGAVENMHRSLKAERIVSIKTIDDELFATIKWKGVEMAECVKLDIVRKYFPQQLLDFYQAHITWRDQSSVDTKSDDKMKVEQ